MGQHITTMQVRAGTDAPVSGQKTYTGSTDTRVEESVPGASTNFEVSFALDVSACKSFFLKSSRDMTIQAFNLAVAGATLVLKADVPYLWNIDTYDTFKFAGDDITKFQCDTAAGAAATLNVLAIVDATP